MAHDTVEDVDPCAGDIQEQRYQTLSQIGSNVQWPLLFIMIFWLSLIFASFGLYAPANRSVLAALLLSALSVGAAVYLIFQLDQPYSGLIKLSSAPLRTAPSSDSAASPASSSSSSA